MRLPALVVLLAAAAARPSAGAEIEAKVLDADGRPQADAVVFVFSHEGTAEPASARAYVMDQVNIEFQPHVMAVPVGSTVRFPNHDNIRHQLYSFSPTKVFETPLYVGELAEPVVFDQPGIVKLGCNIHDWMQGFIVVTPTPYFAKTDAAGRASLVVPDEGRLKLAVFHERNALGLDATLRSLDKTRPKEVIWKLPLRPPSKRPRPDGYR